MLANNTEFRDTLEWNANYFKKGVKDSGFDIVDGDSAITSFPFSSTKRNVATDGITNDPSKYTGNSALNALALSRTSGTRIRGV